MNNYPQSAPGSNSEGTSYQMASQYMIHPAELVGVTISTPTPVGGQTPTGDQWYGYPSPYYMNQWTGEWSYHPQQMYYQTTEQQPYSEHSGAENYAIPPETNSAGEQQPPAPSSVPPPPPSFQYSPPPPPPPSTTTPQPPLPLTSQELQKINTNLSILPPPLPLTTSSVLTLGPNLAVEIIEDLQLRQRKEEEDRTRRLEAENRKKRKFPSSRLNPAQRMRKVDLLAFQDHPTSTSADEMPSKTNSTQTTPSELSSSSSSPPLATTEILTQSQQDFITKTALWVSRNQEKYQNLIENSRNNEKLQFLNEPNSSSGRFFRTQLEKFQIEKTVHDVCAGDGDDSEEDKEEEGRKVLTMTPSGLMTGSGGSQQSSSSAISSLSREEIQRAGREAALLAMSLKRGLFTTVSGTSVSTATLVGGARDLTSIPTVMSADSQREDKKKEKRNRWGPISTPTPSSRE
jgi:hypothetical protein